MKLTEEQMSVLADTFFEDEYYAIEGDVLLIDGPVRVDAIVKAADYIRSLERPKRKKRVCKEQLSFDFKD